MTAKTKRDPHKMNIVIVGHVDHGKSTVIGRLLADTGSLPEGKLEQVQANCRRNAKPFEYAFLLDALKEEQAQGITIDTARCFFKTKKREYIIIDAPGHIEFLKNMVSGAARAEAAILVIDAKEGIQENSKRHGYLLSMLGIRQLTVVVNKMDLVDYQQKIYKQICADYSKFLKQINVTAFSFIPVSAMRGDNITRNSEHMRWYRGPSVVEMLDEFSLSAPLSEKPFRMPVQGVYKFTEEGDDRRIVAGRVESGKVRVGDSVIFLPSNKRSEIKTVEDLTNKSIQEVSAGYSTGFTLSEQIYISRGDVMCKLGEPHPFVGPMIKVRLFWMSRTPFILNKDYKLKIGTDKVTVRLKHLLKVIDASKLKPVRKDKVERHDVSECIIECSGPIAFDLPTDIEATGRFVIVDGFDISGGGLILELVKDQQAEVRRQVHLREEKWDFSIVSKAARAEKYGHKPKLILLTGKVGVDKKTVAKHVEQILFERGLKTYFLGIGNLLRGLDADIDREPRREHVRRLGEVAHLFLDAGLVVFATASNLNDEELKLLLEIVNRDQMVIINIGKNDFRSNIADLDLRSDEKTKKNIDQVLRLLEKSQLLNLEAQD